MSCRFQDEFCVCDGGYVASSMKYRCSNYFGQGEKPAHHDLFQCNECSSARGSYCPGGVTVWPFSSSYSWKAENNDDFFEACPSCTSGYRKVDPFSVAIQGVDWTSGHAPARVCK